MKHVVAGAVQRSEFLLLRMPARDLGQEVIEFPPTLDDAACGVIEDTDYQGALEHASLEAHRFVWKRNVSLIGSWRGTGTW